MTLQNFTGGVSGLAADDAGCAQPGPGPDRRRQPIPGCLDALGR